MLTERAALELNWVDANQTNYASFKSSPRIHSTQQSTRIHRGEAFAYKRSN